jgi:hypothetical protein
MCQADDFSAWIGSLRQDHPATIQQLGEGRVDAVKAVRVVLGQTIEISTVALRPDLVAYLTEQGTVTT